MRAKMSDRNRNNKEDSKGGLTVLVDLNDVIKILQFHIL
jgi:hypothetical protein